MADNQYNGKKLLILGGGIQCLKVVETAQELGLRTVVADLSANRKVVAAADEYLKCSLLDYDALIAYCDAHPVDGILNYCVDFGQHAHQILCNRYGLPCYGPESLYRALTDKDLFKRLLVENGLSIIPTYDPENLDTVEYPVLVKPSESSGSRGSSVCFDREELEEGIRKAKADTRNGHFLLEKYMQGYQDFTMTYVFVDGEPYLTRTADRYLGRLEDGLERQCICSVSPSAFSDTYLEKVHPKVVAMLRKLGLRNGPVFMQGFVDGDTVRFYDPGLRFPGSDYDKVLREATGADPVRMFVRFAMGEPLYSATELKDAFRLNGKCVVQLLVDGRPGTICEFRGLDEVRALPYVVTVGQKSFEGDVVPESKDIKRRLAEVILLVKNDPEIAAAAIREVESLIRVTDEQGEDMLVSRFDPALLQR